MGIKAGIDARELEKFSMDLIRTAERLYPDRAKKFLTKQGNKGKKDLKELTGKRTTKRTGKLIAGIGRTAPKKYKNSLEVQIRSKAPHAHLIEQGHVIWAPVDGWNSPRRRKTNKRTRAFKLAEEVADNMQDDLPKATEEWIEKLLDEGLDLK